MKQRGMREETRKKYFDAVNEIHLALNYNERADLIEICKAHKVSKAIPSILRKFDVIRLTTNGNRWIETQRTKWEILDLIYNEASLINQKNKIKRSKELKTTEPIQYTKNDLNAWKTKINKQKTVSSNIPTKNENEKPVENQKIFELKLFGLTILKIKR
jgi:hypothetical protein